MLNRWVLSRDRKTATEGVEVTRSGRLFHCMQGDLEKSGNSKVVREKSGKMEKVRGSGIRCVFSALNTPKLVFHPGLHLGPRWLLPGDTQSPSPSCSVTTPTVK